MERPLVGYLGKQMCVKYVKSKGIVGMIVNFVIRSRILTLNKPMAFTTLTIDHNWSLHHHLQWRNHPRFSYKNANPFLDPSSQNHPPTPPQKSNLESLIEHFIQTQIKTNKALGEFVSQFFARFESMSTYQKMMETQLPQIA